MKYKRFEELPVWKDAARLFVKIDGLCAEREVRARGDLADQLHRAALSISNNIAEGFEEGTTTQLISYLYHARASAGEVRSMLTVMCGIPRFAPVRASLDDLRAAAESVSRQLGAFLASLQNSSIRGVRYLNDEAREQQERRARVVAFDAQIKTLAGRSSGLHPDTTTGAHGPAEMPASDLRSQI